MRGTLLDIGVGVAVILALAGAIEITGDIIELVTGTDRDSALALAAIGIATAWGIGFTLRTWHDE